MSGDGTQQPVDDWVTRNAPAIWAALRQRCPIAHTDRFGGAWLPTRYDDIAAIAYDTEHFSSRSVIVSHFRQPREATPVGGIPPISSDPPFHRDARRLLLPAFTKSVVSGYESSTREFCNSLINGFVADRVVDAAVEYAQRIPMRVMAELLGFPPEDGPRFRTFVANALEDVEVPSGQRPPDELFDYLSVQVQDHIDRPRDDLTTYLINSELHGDKLHVNHVAGSLALLLIAGIDTTWSAIGASLWHLGQDPEARRRLTADAGLLPTVVEELLRAYAPVTMARLVVDDMHWRGVDMKADDWVLLPFPAANRDPGHFDRADEVIIDRQVNRHAAFGLGIHRCIGSHLARMELRVALDVWLRRIPDFMLDDPDAVTWSPGQIRGPRTLPLRIA